MKFSYQNPTLELLEKQFINFKLPNSLNQVFPIQDFAYEKSHYQPKESLCGLACQR